MSVFNKLFGAPELLTPNLKPHTAVEVDLAHPMARGLEHLWMMNGYGGVERDIANGANGTLTNGTARVVTAHGRAARFDGSNDHIAINGVNKLQGGTPYTIYGLINPTDVTVTDTATYTVIASTSSGSNRHGITIKDSLINFGYYNGSAYVVSESGSVSSGVWVTFVASYDGTNGTLYLNGVEQTGGVNPFLDSGVAFIIGQATSLANKAFAGDMSTLGIYSRGLSAVEAAALSRDMFGMLQPANAPIWLPEVLGGDVNVGAGVVALALTEQAATISQDYNVNAGIVALSLTEKVATITNDINVSAGVVALTLSEQAAGITQDLDIGAGVVALALTEQAATISTVGGVNVSAGVVALSLTELVGTITQDLNVGAGTAALVITEQAATIGAAENVLAGVVSLSLTPQTAVIGQDLNIATNVVGLVLTPKNASVSAGAGGAAAPVIVTVADVYSNGSETALKYSVSVSDGGGVAGLSVSVMIRDGLSYLDFSDATFKTSGWTTKAKTLTDLSGGFYYDSIDLTTITNLPGGNLSLDYTIAGVVDAVAVATMARLDLLAASDALTVGTFMALKDV